MPKLLRVAQYEFLTNLRRRSFLVGAVGVPLLLLGIMAVIIAVSVSREFDLSSIRAVGYVDAAGVLSGGVSRPATYIPFASADEARAALTDEQIDVYFALPADYLTSGRVELVSRSAVPEALKDQIETYLRANLGVGMADDRLRRLQEPFDLTVHTLDNDRRLPQAALAGVFIMPFVFAIVFLMATQVTSGYLMSTIVEEKTNRVIEILVTAVTPFQLLAGKIIGLGALGLVQLAVWAVIGVIIVRLGAGVELLANLVVPLDLLIVAFVYFLFGYAMTASLMASIGAVVGTDQESRQVAGILGLFPTLPLILSVTFILEPDGAVPTFLSIFPLTSPLAVILRMSFSTMPAWQLALSLALLVVATILIAWIGARIFRWSLLMYGKRPSLRAVLRGLRAAGMSTSAEHASADTPLRPQERPR